MRPGTRAGSPTWVLISSNTIGAVAERWQAEIIRQDARQLVLSKPLEDGTVAVGLFNLTNRPRRLEIEPGDLRLKHGARVRDCWRQHDLPDAADALGAEIPAHGAADFRLVPITGWTFPNCDHNSP